jgi:3-oxoacyl-(acyl-carrier-protein) synthase
MPDAKPVSSIKSMLGETFAPASLFQIVSCVGSMHKGIVPPTINYEVRDTKLDLDYVPNKARRMEVRTALISSAGPGGYNAAAVIKYL